MKLPFVNRSVLLQIFLSGFTSPQIEKLKKLLNKGGATRFASCVGFSAVVPVFFVLLLSVNVHSVSCFRFSSIDDSLTHIVVGEIVQNHVEEIDKLDSRF